MVILRCLKCLYLNLCKSYDTKHQKHKNSRNTNLTKLVNSCKNIFKYFQAFLWIPQWKNVIQRPNISHFKGFDMTNLQYEIRVPQKIYRRATIHYWAWYDFLRNRRYTHKAAVLYLTYSRVPNITVGLNKSVGGNFSWKLIKKSSTK